MHNQKVGLRVAHRPELFEVGQHSVEVSPSSDRWSVAVDGAPLLDWYKTPADAWTAGVIEADRQDRLLSPALPRSALPERAKAAA